MIRCGIVGFGKMGKIRAAAIEASGAGRVVLVYDPEAEVNTTYALAKSAKEVIVSEEVDAVFVCTPNHLIPDLCVGALSAGKHVFCEKPPGFNAADVERVLHAERNASGKKLMYGFNHRHHESIKRMHEIVNTQELGKILWMRGRYGKEVDKAYFSGWRADPKLAGAGILLDQGIHMVDLLLFFGGGFDEVRAFVSNLFWKIEGIEDNVFAIFRNSETGCCASLHSTMTQWRYLFSLEVFLQGGSLILNGLKTSSGSYGDEVLTVRRNPSYLFDGRFDQEEVITYNNDTSWQSEVNHFFSCIKHNYQPQYGSGQDALELMRLIDQVYIEGLPRKEV